MNTLKTNDNTISFRKEHGDTSSLTGSNASTSSIQDTTDNNTLKNSVRDSITTASIDLTNCDNKILTGVIVNGFHPQLHNWKERNHCSTSSNSHDNDAITRSNYKSPSLKRCRSNTSLDAKIKERVSRARIDTVQDLNDIQTAIENDHLPFVVEESTATGGSNEDAVPSIMDDGCSIKKLYSDLFEHSDVAQMITAPGGRIAAGKF